MIFQKHNLENVAVIGDIHAVLENLNNILTKVEIEKRNKLVIVGDVLDRGNDVNDVNEVIDVLYNLRHKLIPILGNHDIKLIKHFNNEKVHLGEQQQRTIQIIDDEHIKKYVEIFKDEIVAVYDPAQKIFISHAPGGRPRNILYNNYTHIVPSVGGSFLKTFDDFLNEESHSVQKKHISTLLYGITNGDKDERGFPIRHPITSDPTDDLESWIYFFGHIHSDRFYSEDNKNVICLDFCSGSEGGVIGGAVINNSIDLFC